MVWLAILFVTLMVAARIALGYQRKIDKSIEDGIFLGKMLASIPEADRQDMVTEVLQRNHNHMPHVSYPMNCAACAAESKMRNPL